MWESQKVCENHQFCSDYAKMMEEDDETRKETFLCAKINHL